MEKPYRYVRLIKNRIYPTYRLHAFMANGRTAPQDGLRLAALTTMQWLKNRLGDAAPAEWSAIPDPKDFRSASDADLPSVYVDQGYVINVVSLPDKGAWAMQITEPDLGSDPGAPTQERPPVPGRVIQTGFAFQIVESRLECGFLIAVSDPEGTETEAEVYRPAVVRLLMENPAFGLELVKELPLKPLRLAGKSQMQSMLWLTRHAENLLPSVVFTQPVEQAAPDDLFAPGSPLAPPPPFELPKTLPAAPAPAAVREPPYDLDAFARHTLSFCRVYIAEHTLTGALGAQLGQELRPGDAVLLRPVAMGGGTQVFPLRTAEGARKETLYAIERSVKDGWRTADVDFGHIAFLSGVREQLLGVSDELTRLSADADDRLRAELARLDARRREEAAQKDRELADAAEQLRRQKEYASRLEKEKAELRDEFDREKQAMRVKLETHEATIQFLKRRLDQPRDYDGIPAWVEEHFSERLLLHPKAVARMLDRSHQCAGVELICDALDFLATDHWEMRYLRVPEEVALTRCAEKYGRPFTVKPTGQATIDYTPGEYRIKYGKNARGKSCESDLDYHLRVGNDTENLLRIYFLYDDPKQKIVVGSLPDHLRAVSIQ